MKLTNIADVLGLTERTVTTNGRRSVIRLERTYGTSAEDLWEACTDPGRMGRWLGVATGEFREGGMVRLCMTPPDDDVVTLEVVRCDAPRRLVVRWSYLGQADSVVELNLDPGSVDETTLSLEHIALSGALPMEYGGGWEDFLIRLGTLLDGGDPEGFSSSDVEQSLAAAWTDATNNAPDDGRWPSVDSAQDGSATLTASHSYAAGRADVWTAITDRDRLSSWMAPATGEFRVGGEWTIAYDNGAASGTVRECEPHERIVTTWQWAHESDWPPSTVTVELADGPNGGTIVSLRQERSSAPGEGYAAGWYAYLRSLERNLAGRDASEADWQADWIEALAMLRP